MKEFLTCLGAIVVAIVALFATTFLMLEVSLWFGLLWLLVPLALREM